MNQIDSLYEVEQELYKTRMLTTISLRDIRNADTKVHIIAMYNIEKHRDYIVENLINYAKVLGRKLFLDGKPIGSVLDIGRILKEKREQAGLSMFAAYTQSHVLPKAISKIELGKRYRKSTLVNYIAFYNLNFTLD